MAQVVSNSDPKFSKGGGSAKKSKPTREALDDMIKKLKDFTPHVQDEALERVLEKNNYDIEKSVEYIFEGNPIPTESSEWQQVTRNTKQETKAKTQDKKPEGVSEKKEKGFNRTEFDKNRDDKRNDGRAGKPKKPDARFKQDGFEGTPDAHRGPRDSKSNGSPNPQSRPPRKSPAPVHAGAPGTKPAVGAHTPQQQSQQSHPTTQSPHPSTSHHTWGPPGGHSPAVTAPATTSPTPTPAQSQSQPQSTQSQAQAQSQQQPTPSSAASSSSAASRPSFNTTTATSYSKIVQGKPQPAPPTQQPAASHPPSSHAQPAASAAAGAAATAAATPSAAPSATPSTTAPSGKQPEFQSPSGSRSHNKASPTWRPKETSSSPSLTNTSAASGASTPTPAASTPSNVSLPAAQPTTTPAPVAAPAQAQAPSQPTPAAQAPVPQAAQPAPQATPAQPAPISPPTANTQPKRQPVVVGGGNVIFPPSLQYADNLSFQFGSIGLDNKPKELPLNFGTQPTSAPAQQAISPATQPIHPPAAQTHSAAPAQPAAPVQQHTQPQPQVPAQQAHPSQQHAHSPSQHVSHAHAHAQPGHIQSHIPSHQQQLHLSGDPNLGHLVQEQTDMHGYPYMPPYFPMPTFGFSDANSEEALRMSRPYYEHPGAAGYGAPADSNASQSAVPQNSQSPPPNSSNQYQPMPYYPYSYMPHGYYQTSAPSQFQGFPGSYMYGYNRMGGAGGYPPQVHSGSSASTQGHSQYDETEYNKYISAGQPGAPYSNSYASSPSYGASGVTAGSNQGVQQGSASSVSKPAQSFSPSGTEGGKDYNSSNKYNAHRNEPSSFYNLGQQPQPFSHHQPFMQQHIGGPQSIPSSQSSAYHHSPQPLSNQPHVQGQSGSRPHYSTLS